MARSDEASEAHGHHLPAVEDFPRGFGEASWWPFVTAVGGAGIYAGAALFLLSRGDSTVVPAWIGAVVFGLGAVGFLVGLFGWLYHAFVKTFRERAPDWKSASKLRWAMVTFLGTEVATFGAGFAYYFFVRVGPWNTGAVPDLLGSIIIVNTLVLVASSATLHWAEGQLKADNRRNFVVGLAVTLLLGVLFILGQAWEYYEFLVHENFSIFTTEGLEKVFASAFYGLTGLHGLHVSLGAVLLAILLVRALYGQYSPERHVSVQTVSMYWHFVDAVWIFLVGVIYVGATV